MEKCFTCPLLFLHYPQLQQSKLHLQLNSFLLYATSNTINLVYYYVQHTKPQISQKKKRITLHTTKTKNHVYHDQIVRNIINSGYGTGRRFALDSGRVCSRNRSPPPLQQLEMLMVGGGTSILPQEKSSLSRMCVCACVFFSALLLLCSSQDGFMNGTG